MMTISYLESFPRMTLLKNWTTLKQLKKSCCHENHSLYDTATAKDAIVMMDEAPFGIIPIIDKTQKVLGVVTRGSLLSAMSSQWTETEENPMNNLNIWQQLVEQSQMRWKEVLEATSVHIQLVFFSMLIAIVLGITLGIVITRVPKLTTIVLGGAGVMQTIPSLALLGFMIPIFGIGVKTAIAALFLYSLLPIIRNTYTGIKDVDKATTEAAKGMGMTSMQILLKVELPLAIPVIMAGIRTAAVINVGTATLAAFIGAGGLGDFIFLGITRGIDGLILLGAIPAAILAIILETLFGGIERWTTPKGLK